MPRPSMCGISAVYLQSTLVAASQRRMKLFLAELKEATAVHADAEVAEREAEKRTLQHMAGKGDNDLSAFAEIHESLSILQHRGQDAAGIVTCGSKGRLYQLKGGGLVRDLFEGKNKSPSQLPGYMGVGHVRYPTAGTLSDSEAQPFYVNSPYGIVMAHNGNLTNARELKNFLDYDVHRHINTDSDSELLLNIFANNLQATGKARINEEDIFNAIDGIYRQCRGAYACVAMIAGFGIIAFRGIHGIRPLCYGTRKVLESPSDALDSMVSSESVALDALGYTNIEDVAPGAAIIISESGISHRQIYPKDELPSLTPCLFEYVYFSRPDSILNGISVYTSRLNMGEYLAAKIKRLNISDIDVVIPVPDTSRVAALQVAYYLEKPYREGFIKNRYVGRTFIMPGQNLRKLTVRRKLNAMSSEFKGKNVLIVDDSIVRGTTSKEIICMARDSGAVKVYLASCAPAIRYANVYGIDMPSTDELVASKRSDDAIAKHIGADLVIYQELEDLVEACRKLNPTIPAFDTSVFDGNYVTGDITDDYLSELRGLRGAKPSPALLAANKIRKSQRQRAHGSDDEQSAHMSPATLDRRNLRMSSSHSNVMSPVMLPAIEEGSDGIDNVTDGRAKKKQRIMVTQESQKPRRDSTLGLYNIGDAK